METIKGIRTIRREAVDPRDPIRLLNTGFFEEPIGDRQMLTFVPDDARSATAGVFVLPPDGVSAREMAEKSSWVELAQSEECKERFIVFFLEGRKGVWHTEEPFAAPGGETAYLRAAFEAANRRHIYCVHEAKFYLAGYGAGGVIAQKAAAEDPAVYAGVAAVGSPALDADYLKEAGDADAVDLGLFQNDGLGIPRDSIPVPVYLIGSETTEQLAQRPEIRHWCAAAGVDEIPSRIDTHTVAFTRSKETPFPMDQDKAAHRVWVGSYEDPLTDFGNRLNRRIWKDFLYPVRRWMSEPGGSLRMTEDPLRDLGMEYHYESVGGWMREWYVYVPSQVKADPEKQVPLVFACHGYSCSGEIYMGNAGWNRVADKYGFIVVFPSATYGPRQGVDPETPPNTPLPAWNVEMDPARVDEAVYFRHMLADVTAHHAVDTGRVYITGHSNGSLMTQYLASFMPEVFAAAAPCSGVLFRNMLEVFPKAPRLAQRAQVDIPVWMFAGEKEAWLLPHLPEKDNTSGRTIQYWWKLNRMPGEMPQDFSQGWTVFRSRWNDLTYRKGDAPMIRYTWLNEFPHATNIEMSFRIWEEFFSRFSRRPDGTLVFHG